MAEPAVAGGGLVRRRWLLLWVIGLAQLMVVLDLTVLNIALPSAQRTLGFYTVDRQWVVTAYTLSFGSLLRLGGTRVDTSGLAQAMRATGAPLEVLDIGDETARAVYGYDLLLLRPDLHVAWRGNQPPDDAKRLAAIVTGRANSE